MARIMAIDYGTKRTGIAVTDKLRMIASPLTTVHPNELLAFLQTYFFAEEVDLLVVGKPLRADGTDPEVEKHIVGAIRAIQRAFPGLEIVRHDERYTSQMASKALIDGGLKKKKRQDKALLDKVAAAIMLQDYLQQQEMKK